MGSSAAEIVLDLRLCSGRTFGGLLKDSAAEIGAGDGRVAKLEESVRSLEEERTKIEAFKRELPLCMLLLTDVIEGLKKELNRWRGERFVHAFEEFIPITSKRDEEIGAQNDADCKEKISWMTSAQLWSDSSSEEKNDENRSISKERNGRSDRRGEENLFSESNSRGSALVPFGSSIPIVNSEEEIKPRIAPPELSLVPVAVNNSFSPVSSGSDEHFCVGPASKGVSRAPVPAPASIGAHLSLRLQQQQQLPRKARRCWSQELHRKFVHALQQLGGAQVATPKQIRDLMKVDGLTNDEVKSHLQKYRLHTRRTPNVSATNADRPIADLGVLWVPPEDCTTSPQQSFSQSGSPQSPLQLAGSIRAIAATAADSYEEEEEKSESYNWK